MITLGIIASSYRNSDTPSPFTPKYYVSNDGNNTNDGLTPETSWQTLNKVQQVIDSFEDGDVIAFKAGDTFNGRCEIDVDFAIPLVLTKYGNGPKPKFTGTGGKIDWLFYMNRNSGVVLDNLHITSPTLSDSDRTIASLIDVAILMEITTGIIIQNCEFDKVGIAANIVEGSNNEFIYNNVSNLRMIKIDGGGDDDYGANGILLANTTSNLIQGNYFNGCWAVSPDYGLDGGAIEFYGADTNDNVIVHNTITDSLIIAEFGSGSAGTISNNTFAYNKFINNGSLFYRNAGTFNVAVTNLNVYNNVIIETIVGRLDEECMISSGGTPGANTINFIGNIVQINTNLDLFKGGQWNNTNAPHSANVLKLSGGSSYNLSLGTNDATTTDQLFANESGDPLNWNYHTTLSIVSLIENKIPTALYTTDFAGTMVNSPADIGIYEI